MGKLFDLDEATSIPACRTDERSRRQEARRCARGGTRDAHLLPGRRQTSMPSLTSPPAAIIRQAPTSIYGGTFQLFLRDYEGGNRLTFFSPTARKRSGTPPFLPTTKGGFGEKAIAQSCADRAGHLKNSPTRPRARRCRSSWTIPSPRRSTRSFRVGAAISVTHSTTKYIDGHGAPWADCIVDSGKSTGRSTRRFSRSGTARRRLSRRSSVTYTSASGWAARSSRNATAQLCAIRLHPCRRHAFLSNTGAGKPACAHERHCENGLWPWPQYRKNNPRSSWGQILRDCPAPRHRWGRSTCRTVHCGVVFLRRRRTRRRRGSFMGKAPDRAIETPSPMRAPCCLHSASRHPHRQHERRRACRLRLNGISCATPRGWRTQRPIADIELAWANKEARRMPSYPRTNLPRTKTRRRKYLCS